jgi:hypothetical protein
MGAPGAPGGTSDFQGGSRTGTGGPTGTGDTSGTAAGTTGAARDDGGSNWGWIGLLGLGGLAGLLRRPEHHEEAARPRERGTA